MEHFLCHCWALLSQASNIDDVLSHHTSFLDNCLKDCMLTNPELLKIFSKLMSVCVMFTNCMQVCTASPCHCQPLCQPHLDLPLFPLPAALGLNSSHPLPDGFLLHKILLFPCWIRGQIPSAFPKSPLQWLQADLSVSRLSSASQSALLGAGLGRAEPCALPQGTAGALTVSPPLSPCARGSPRA